MICYLTETFCEEKVYKYKEILVKLGKIYNQENHGEVVVKKYVDGILG